MTTWITDADGNKCSVEYFGSAGAAQKALDSLKDCRNCVNCSGCLDCSRCSRCLGCSGLAGDLPPVVVPKITNIHETVYAAASQPKSLNMKDWHTCANTHCRAGWVVTLAGKTGAILEERFNTELAAMLIYAASSEELHVNPARFYDDNETALADMKRLAEIEAGAQP